MTEAEDELVTDFRMIFSISFYEIGKSVSYKETFILLQALLRNPNSFYHAFVNNWESPRSFEWLQFTNYWDDYRLTNTDSDHRGDWEAVWRPYKTQPIGQLNNSKPIPLEIAKELYAKYAGFGKTIKD